MGIEYKLQTTSSGKYFGLFCEKESGAIIRHLRMYGFGDCISFERKTGKISRFGSDFGLSNLGCFKELKGYERLADMPEQDLGKLAARIYELLYTPPNWGSKEYYSTIPNVNASDKKYLKIINELHTLQNTQKIMVDSGKLVFPKISDEEVEMQESW